MREEFQKFNDTIANITSPAQSMFGEGLPGMVGASGQQEGILNSAAEMVRTLRRNVAELNQEFTHKPNSGRVKELSAAIEGSLLGLQTLSIVDQKQVDDVMSQLSKIVDHK